MYSGNNKSDTKLSEQELNRQQNYIKKIRDYNNEKYKSEGYTPRAFTHTFGCQMNVRDTETIAGLLAQMGYAVADNETSADLVLFNTCCVRENAENKTYGNLGILKHRKKDNPELKVVVCGCMTQQVSVIEEMKKNHSHVNVIFGTYNLHRFPELLYTNIETGENIIDIWEEHGEIVEDLPAVRNDKHKAGINIMYGCNNFCAYCIVPYVRGRERSRRLEDIIAEARALAKDGVVELLLLGQNVNSYGKTLDEPVSFSQLLRMLNEVDGIKRIRFMTSHPKDLSDELIFAIRDCDKVCKHIHLPMQSGSSYILKKMNRGYTKEQFLELIAKIKRHIPQVTCSTDIIVGFPEETEEHFLDTLDVVERAEFNAAYTFIYSKRTGTPAARHEQQVAADIAKERFQRLLTAVNSIISRISNSFVGGLQEVLVEEYNEKENILTGRTDGNSIVHFSGDEDLRGRLVTVRITGCKTFYLMGELERK